MELLELRLKDDSLSDALINACIDVNSDECHVERQKAYDALKTYKHLTYLNPPNAQIGYMEIQHLLSGTSLEAQTAYNILEGYTQAFRNFGYSEQEARHMAGSYVSAMYLLGGISAIKASPALTKQFGVDIAKKPINVQVIISLEMEQKILYGQRVVKENGQNTNRIKGGHSGQISDSNPQYAVEVISVNSDGTRVVKFLTQFDDGNLSKIKTSTLFPESWSDKKIMNAVTTTGSSKSVATRASDGASLHQSTIDGVKVEVIKIGNNVTAGYPCGKGCMTIEQFKGQ